MCAPSADYKYVSSAMTMRWAAMQWRSVHRRRVLVCANRIGVLSSRNTCLLSILLVHTSDTSSSSSSLNFCLVLSFVSSRRVDIFTHHNHRLLLAINTCEKGMWSSLLVYMLWWILIYIWCWLLATELVNDRETNKSVVRPKLFTVSTECLFLLSNILFYSVSRIEVRSIEVFIEDQF